jgi:Fe-S cluster biogenesis protein NfuA
MTEKPMVEEKAFQQRIQQIERLIAKLDEAGDLGLRSCAKDLVGLIMDLHGTGLERMMSMISQTGEAGQRLTERFDRDDLVRSLLLLYGLHPLDFETRVRRAIEKAGPSLSASGARAELLSLTEGVVRVRILGSLKGCGAAGVKATLEDAIYAAAPDLAGLSVEGEAEKPSVAFFPLASLLNPASNVLRGSGRP